MESSFNLKANAISASMAPSLNLKGDSISIGMFIRRRLTLHFPARKPQFLPLFHVFPLS